MPAPRSRRREEAQRLLDLLNALGTTTFRQVVFYVNDHTGCHMGDVGKAFGVTLPAVTHIVDRLEEKDFLRRADDPVDRRAYVLELTRAGRALVQELHGMQMRGIERVLRRMSLEDRQRVLKGLEALVDASAEAVKA